VTKTLKKQVSDNTLKEKVSDNTLNKEIKKVVHIGTNWENRKK
jgi:hypothetical protein